MDTASKKLVYVHDGPTTTGDIAYLISQGRSDVQSHDRAERPQGRKSTARRVSTRKAKEDADGKPLGNLFAVVAGPGGVPVNVPVRANVYLPKAHAAKAPGEIHIPLDELVASFAAATPSSGGQSTGAADLRAVFIAEGDVAGLTALYEGQGMKAKAAKALAEQHVSKAKAAAGAA